MPFLYKAPHVSIDKAYCSTTPGSRLTFVFILLLMTQLSWAQTPLIEEQAIGKGNTTFHGIFQDAEGFMWFNHSKGLIKFDGTKQTNFLEGSENQDVRAVAQLGQGVLWLGMGSGNIYTMTQDSLSIFKPTQDFLAEAVSDLLFDHDGNLWIASEGDGLYYYTQERLYRLDEEDGLPDIFIYDLMTDAEGRVWACTDNGIAICSLEGNKAKISLLNKSNGLPDDIIRKAILAPDSTVWIGTEDKGFVQWLPKEQKVKQPLITSQWSYGPISDMDIEAGQLWVATEKTGMIAYKTTRDQWQIYNQKDGLKSKGLKAVKKDIEGNIWYIGKKNIYRSYSNQVSFIRNFAPATTKGNVVDLTVTQDSIWLINEDGLFLRHKNERGQATVSKHLATDENNTFISLYADTYGNLWIGTYGNGLIQYNHSTGKSQRFIKELSNSNIMDITGKENTLYLSTLKGITVATRQTDGSYSFQVYNQSNGLKASYIYQTFIDSQNRLWLATDGQGLVLMENERFQYFTEEDGIKNRTIYGVTEDRNHDIWVNTIDNGLYQYQNKKFLHFYEKYGLQERNIQSIGSDSQGNIVMAHDLGIELLDVETLKTYLFDGKYGLTGAKPNLNSLVKNINEDLMIGTNQGIILFQGMEGEGQLPSFPFIEGLKVSGKSISLNQKELVFSHDQNHLTINYLGLSYLNPKGLTFSYRLDNYELEWLLSKNTDVTYSNLPPGNYVFRLRVSHNQSFEDNKEVSIAFTIQPPIWQRTWVQILLLLLVSLLAYTFIKRREKALRESKLLLEQKVQERTVEIQEQNEELKMQRDQIKGQNEAITESSKQLAAAFQAIEKKNENITKSINYAKRIQTSILPTQEALKEAFEEHFIFYLPKDVVSGDFYWFYKVGKRIYFAVVDCTGHGVPGAFMSLIGYSQLNEIISREPFISPAAALEKLNKGVIKALRQDKTGQRNTSKSDGMDLALICWDQTENMLSIGLSKRPIMIVENNELHEIKGDRISIGGEHFKKGQEFTDHLFPIGDGLKIYLFSDGYADQFGGPQGRKMGIQNIRVLLKNNCHLPMNEQLAVYEKYFADWKGTERQIDDVIIAGISLLPT